MIWLLECAAAGALVGALGAVYDFTWTGMAAVYLLSGWMAGAFD
jgi:hypothetical protein